MSLAAVLAWSNVSASDPAIEPTSADQTLPLADLRTFAEVFGRIKDEYVETVQDKSLIEGAIRGMLANLDPHSAYLNTEEYRDLQVGTRGEFGGLGIEVGMEDGFVKVIAPIDDTPAQRAGLQAGDTIIRIDQKPVKGLSLNDAVNLMRGQAGTKIELTIMRDNEERPFDVTIERAIIQVASVRGRTLEPGYGYLRISHFQARTTEDVVKAVESLKTSSGGSLKGLVLDLRNNPGGVLNSAVGVSDAFLGGGLIVYTKGRHAESELQFQAGPDDVLAGAPIVVLVNSGSASASEIVAGALQDHKRAIVMGNQTFGKGSVQTIVPIDDATALKLTTARYYTPSGRSIQAQGIVPDIELQLGEFKPLTGGPVEDLKESDLVRHLDEPAPESGVSASNGASLLAEDFQLAEALNMLKGLNILGRPADNPTPDS
ncbi:MAG: S41 family peptidase [Sphingobacteriia bacterium]|nr:S41 family peptidase [Sphingobacteriia bacterium]NCC38678.1 S41 family peptidase [Gammaproteobacteria bacterium]